MAIDDAIARADTFPKLLAHNARVHGDRPALRHKDLGIWQTWTWAQVLDMVRAYALGLHRLGLNRGDAIAIATDVSSESDTAQAIAAVEARWGALHVLVHGAAAADPSGQFRVSVTWFAMKVPT